ncbi:MAG: hypothetical protein CL910_05535 [Deltaproteobacteria bacterium]|jgi:hypothetical protein|nr:hypothetical protein [Deltaproteobacteria bacterium]
MDELAPETLRGIVEAFVGREGTDYGDREASFGEKIEDVFRQLRSGEAVIVFDPESESVNVVLARESPDGG